MLPSSLVIIIPKNRRLRNLRAASHVAFRMFACPSPAREKRGPPSQSPAQWRSGSDRSAWAPRKRRKRWAPSPTATKKESALRDCHVREEAAKLNKGRWAVEPPEETVLWMQPFSPEGYSKGDVSLQLRASRRSSATLCFTFYLPPSLSVQHQLIRMRLLDPGSHTNHKLSRAGGGLPMYGPSGVDQAKPNYNLSTCFHSLITSRTNSLPTCETWGLLSRFHSWPVPCPSPTSIVPRAKAL